MTTEFIRGAGAAIVTRSVLDGRTPVKWMVREEPIEPPDSGWRFIGMHDTQADLDDADNMVVVDYNSVCEVEPTSGRCARDSLTSASRHSAAWSGTPPG